MWAIDPDVIRSSIVSLSAFESLFTRFGYTLEHKHRLVDICQKEGGGGESRLTMRSDVTFETVVMPTHSPYFCPIQLQYNMLAAFHLR